MSHWRRIFEKLDLQGVISKKRYHFYYTLTIQLSFTNPIFRKQFIFFLPTFAPPILGSAPLQGVHIPEHHYRSGQTTMSFFVELWESVFTPGTSPALLKATHGSFILLLLSLLSLIYYTGSIHFINLFVIALLLYASVIWFVKELQSAKLKNNNELGSDVTEKKEEKPTASTTRSSTSARKSAKFEDNLPKVVNGVEMYGTKQTARKRKV